MRLVINEIDQTIVDADLATYDAPNQFIRDLIDAARETGEAMRHDADGCPVTATIAEDPRGN